MSHSTAVPVCTDNIPFIYIIILYIIRKTTYAVGVDLTHAASRLWEVLEYALQYYIKTFPDSIFGPAFSPDHHVLCAGRYVIQRLNSSLCAYIIIPVYE